MPNTLTDTLYCTTQNPKSWRVLTKKGGVSWKCANFQKVLFPDACMNFHTGSFVQIPVPCIKRENKFDLHVRTGWFSRSIWKRCENKKNEKHFSFICSWRSKKSEIIVFSFSSNVVNDAYFEKTNIALQIHFLWEVTKDWKNVVLR